MKFARSIKIGAHTWRLRKMLKKPAKDAAYNPKEQHGLCDSVTHVIWLNAELATKPSLLAEIIFHEITHAINDHCGVGDGATEEHVTTQVARGWVQVMADNPTLMPYLQQLLAMPGTSALPPVSVPGDRLR